MSYTYASGQKAIAICDVCGFQYRLRQLKELIVKGNKTNIRACPECWNPDQPQLMLGTVPVQDPQAIRNPRSDSAELVASRDIQWGWDPVGLSNPFGITPDDLEAVGVVGQVTVLSTSGTIPGGVNVSGVAATASAGSVTVTVPAFTTFAITVSNPGAGNRYYVDSVLQATLTLSEGSTYRLDQSNGSNSSHPLRFSTTSDGTHGGGSEYTTGVTTSGIPGNAGAYTQITVASGAPTLYYYCTNHSGMGGQANTP